MHPCLFLSAPGRESAFRLMRGAQELGDECAPRPGPVEAWPEGPSVRHAKSIYLTAKLGEEYGCTPISFDRNSFRQPGAGRVGTARASRRKKIVGPDSSQPLLRLGPLNRGEGKRRKGTSRKELGLPAVTLRSPSRRGPNQPLKRSTSTYQHPRQLVTLERSRPAELAGRQRWREIRTALLVPGDYNARNVRVKTKDAPL
jgi:hypothetical protein